MNAMIMRRQRLRQAPRRPCRQWQERQKAGRGRHGGHVKRHRGMVRGHLDRRLQVTFIVAFSAISDAVLDAEIHTETTNSTKKAIEIRFSAPTSIRPTAVVTERPMASVMNTAQ